MYRAKTEVQWIHYIRIPLGRWKIIPMSIFLNIPEYSYMAGLGSFIIVINSITINCSFDIIIILFGIQNIVLVCRPKNCSYVIGYPSVRY